MGTNSLPKLATAPTLVPATTTQYNTGVDALQGHQVMRDSDGLVEDDVSTYGRPSSGRPHKIYVGSGGLNVNGNDIDFSAIALQTTGISSGKAKDSGFPNYLTPLGATGGATNTFTIEAATTNLVMTIDGEAYTLEADLESDDLALAPSSNNTCQVNDPYIDTDPHWSKTIGEYGYWITIDETGGVGSEISDLDGTVQAFSINNGEDTEVFLAEIDMANYRLTPIIRGVGGTDRIAFSDADTITLLKAHYIFLDNDLVTVDTTTTYPTYGTSAPAVPAEGDYHFYTNLNAWYRFSGVSWEKLGRIYLGYAICDDSDCLYVEHEDFNLAWNESNFFDNISVSGTDTFIISSLDVNVTGQRNVCKSSLSLSLADNLEDGLSELASTWYFIYVSSSGYIYLSDKIPRNKDWRCGYYHPQEYWRCIGMIYNNHLSNLIASYYNQSIGIHSMNNSDQIDFETPPSDPAWVVLSCDKLTPIAKHIGLEIISGDDYLTLREIGFTSVTEYIYSNAALDYSYRDISIVRNSVMQAYDNSSPGSQASLLRVTKIYIKF